MGTSVDEGIDRQSACCQLTVRRLSSHVNGHAINGPPHLDMQVPDPLFTERGRKWTARDRLASSPGALANVFRADRQIPLAEPSAIHLQVIWTR
jgi:hypothetical protein